MNLIPLIFRRCCSFCCCQHVSPPEVKTGAKRKFQKVKSASRNKTFRILSFPFSHCLSKRFLNQCPWRSEERRRREDRQFSSILWIWRKRGGGGTRKSTENPSPTSPPSPWPQGFSAVASLPWLCQYRRMRARTFSFSTSVS